MRNNLEAPSCLFPGNCSVHYISPMNVHRLCWIFVWKAKRFASICKWKSLFVFLITFGNYHDIIDEPTFWASQLWTITLPCEYNGTEIRDLNDGKAHHGDYRLRGSNFQDRWSSSNHSSRMVWCRMPKSFLLEGLETSPSTNRSAKLKFLQWIFTLKITSGVTRFLF